MNRREVLDTAAEVVDGPRHDDYGDASESFGRIAILWSGILGLNISASDVAMCMAAMKLARLANTPTHADSWVDLIGYAALGAEVSSVRGAEVAGTV